MTDNADILSRIEDQADRFPMQMMLVNDVFKFSFGQAEKVSRTFDCNTDLFAMIRKVVEFLESSDLDQGLKEEVVELLREEYDVIAYSQTARCSVISM